MDTIRCGTCGARNVLPKEARRDELGCFRCGADLKPAPQPGDTSAAVGLIGGAALGAAIGGPVGAIVGGLLGAVLGREAKGVG